MNMRRLFEEAEEMEERGRFGPLTYLTVDGRDVTVIEGPLVTRVMQSGPLRQFLSDNTGEAVDREETNEESNGMGRGSNTDRSVVV